MRWLRPVILALQSLQQEDHHEFQTSLGYRGRLGVRVRVGESKEESEMIDDREI